jgi:hypothetical protein
MIGFMKSELWAAGILVATARTTNAFIAPMQQQQQQQQQRLASAPIFPNPMMVHTASSLTALSAEEEENEGNPFQDPNYPDLEFVDYSDPEYQVDQGTGDEFFDSSSTEERVEEMREERRVKNDEYQFETYYKDVLKEGQEFKGEWTVFRTSTFIDGDTDADGRPRLSKAIGPFKVISRGERVNIASEKQESSDDRLEFERILHHEKIFNDPDDAEEKTAELLKEEKLSMGTKFWPDQLSSLDFRGQQGIMCVGNAYSICTSTPLGDSKTPHEGPYASYSAELGLTSEEDVRFRIKLDYSVVEKDTKEAPPLHLKSFTICRETLGMWPRAQNYKSAIEAITQDALFGPRGADGGLYDPPPIGSEKQKSQYLLLDLEGRATVLLPYLMDQDPEAHDGYGWVTTLDWTPGSQRYQLDRKTKSGKNILGLRTLELTEVQSAAAETYRPSDGGENMRQ